jgi:hypothetical protein
MKYRIRATHNNQTFEFNLYDSTWWLRLLYNTGGITLGSKSVYLKRTLTEAINRNKFIVGHEAIHIIQANTLGWKYIPTYIWQAIKVFFIKHNIPMEREAYTKEQQVSWEIVT